MKKFDLNIEKILEDWETYHAIREVIANALDEQVLTKTEEIQIFNDCHNCWHIRDFGRGLKYEHLTQKENNEKLQNPHLIGKFGVGIKDALATFNRRGIKIFIKSAHGDITLGKSQKHDFDDINTLHAYISPPIDNKFIGTEFILDGCKEEDVNRAKNLFLIFSGEKVIEKTQYGEVLEKKGTTSKIYINGVKVSEEENFLFSYNITSLTKSIKKALNRERNNVGRTAYSDRVKAILLACKGRNVMKKLAQDLEGYRTGGIHDEVKWSDVSAYASKILSSSEKIVFFTPSELADTPEMVDKARRDGFEVVTVPDSIREKIKNETDLDGNQIRDLDEFRREWNESFEFKFVEPRQLRRNERKIFEKTRRILEFIGGKPKNVKEIRISETMRMNNYGYNEATGIWEEVTGRIIIKRTQLRSLEDYASTLLHEIAHSISRAPDLSSEFEKHLTSLIGVIISNAFRRKDKKSFLW